ncbi:Hypothetical protein BQ3484_37 [Cedratvirus A11]|uniref:Uncharacterized protein n=1 Tax=Cedratvirus A11 TaxID=1903266 RepID=A0A1M7XTW0_9VIRU|nr:Hypothetical protein BQ3484_37 [Cedratvirus A11]SHO33105.1 Hypothetical protein BQ3484_37 [Cedratvirus A11]
MDESTCELLSSSCLTPRDYIYIRGCYVCGRSPQVDLTKTGKVVLCSFHQRVLCNFLTSLFTQGYLESLTDYQCTALRFTGKCTDAPEKDKPRCAKHHRGGLESLVLFR